MVAVTHRQSGEQECCVDRGQRCAGQKCMAWRWYGTGVRRILDPNFNRQLADDGEGRPHGVGDGWTFHPWKPATAGQAYWEEPVEAANASRLGFCGLAGRPNTL